MVLKILPLPSLFRKTSRSFRGPDFPSETFFTNASAGPDVGAFRSPPRGRAPRRGAASGSAGAGAGRARGRPAGGGAMLSGGPGQTRARGVRRGRGPRRALRRSGREPPRGRPLERFDHGLFVLRIPFRMRTGVRPDLDHMNSHVLQQVPRSWLLGDNYPAVNFWCC